MNDSRFEEDLERWMKGEKTEFKPQGKKKIHFKRHEFGRTALVEGQQYNFDFIAREEWGAKKPKHTEVFSELMADVVVGFTDTNECHNVFECIALVNKLQAKHMKAGEPDIKHNFIVCGDGHVYECRGWHVKPPPELTWPEIAHCSINISYAGKKGQFPPKPLAKIAMELIDFASKNQCLQEHVGIYFDYFDERHDVVDWINKHPNYTNPDAVNPADEDDDAIHL